MTDKRNIVIKVKYPVAGKKAESATPKMITEWNIKRILLAATALVLILVSLIYLVGNDTQEADVNNAEVTVNTQETPPVEVKETETKNLDIPKQTIEKTNPPVKPKKESNKKQKQTDDIREKENIKKQPTEKVIKGQGYSKDNHNVVRASLTYQVNNKEPAGDTVQTVNTKHKKPVWVYYFTELKTMNGNKVYHEWLKNGSVVSKQALVISGDIWRTSSRKLLSGSEQGDWSVRLVDEKGRLLNEKKFKVE